MEQRNPLKYNYRVLSDWKYFFSHWKWTEVGVNERTKILSELPLLVFPLIDSIVTGIM